VLADPVLNPEAIITVSRSPIINPALTEKQSA